MTERCRSPVLIISELDTRHGAPARCATNHRHKEAWPAFAPSLAGMGGGVEAQARNLIAFNANLGGGVTADVTSSENRIPRNAIQSNLGLGIDLGANGITPNHAGDGGSIARACSNNDQCSNNDCCTDAAHIAIRLPGRMPSNNTASPLNEISTLLSG